MPTTKHNSSGHATETPDVSHLRNVDVSHEVSDVSIGSVMTFVAALTALTIVVCAGLVLLFNFYSRQQVANEPEKGPLAMSREERLPPEPRLQGARGFARELDKQAGVTQPENMPKGPLWEIEFLRRQWTDVLEKGPRDQSGALIGMPITEAMKKIAGGNALPSNVAANASSSLDDYGIKAPTAESSGRVNQTRR